MKFAEMIDAVTEAERTLSAARLATDRMAGLVAGNLRSGEVHPYILDRLKRELREYNIQTGKWKK